ncbi:MAG TPA: peptidoglycan editing factor PgeF [Vicinamibacterales bacterium]|nr:peptidoglycan editing factor PgeF [Vicinamibacterales bacterium]
MEPSGGFAWVQAGGRPALVCRPLEATAHHLYTTRQWALGTPENAVATEPDRAWEEIAGAAGVQPDHLVRVRQIHGVSVHRARAGLRAGPLPEADIIISNDPSVAIAIQTADCVPLLLADTRGDGVAAVHAGWRGLALRAPSVGVEALVRAFGTRPDDIVAAAGPSISAARYEVGADVRQRFEHGGFDRLDRWFLPGVRAEHWQFDGWQATRDQLVAAGLAPERILIAALCTAANPDSFCSYRRAGSPAGRMAAVIRARGGNMRLT